MSTIAIVMMVVFIIVIWGGLALALTHLIRNGDATSGDLGADADYSNDQLYAVERPH